MATCPQALANGALPVADFERLDARAQHTEDVMLRVRLRDGLPVLKEFTHAESVDVVTRAGAGGMILTESANVGNVGIPTIPTIPTIPSTTIQTQEALQMETAEIQKLIEAAVAKATSPLQERALRGDAAVEANRILSSVTLPEASKQRVVDMVLREALPLTEGKLDAVKFADLVNAEAKREGAYVASLTGAGRVTGMGSYPGPVADPAAETKLREASATTHKRALSGFSEFGLPAGAAKAIADGYGEAA